MPLGNIQKMIERYVLAHGYKNLPTSLGQLMTISYPGDWVPACENTHKWIDDFTFDLKARLAIDDRYWRRQIRRYELWEYCPVCAPRNGEVDQDGHQIGENVNLNAIYLTGEYAIGDWEGIVWAGLCSNCKRVICAVKQLNDPADPPPVPQGRIPQDPPTEKYQG